MTPFHPPGLRAIAGGNQDGSCTNPAFDEYLVQANRERFIFLHVEGQEVLHDIEAIAYFYGLVDRCYKTGQAEKTSYLAAHKQKHYFNYYLAS